MLCDEVVRQETFRYCAKGDWDSKLQENGVLRLNSDMVNGHVDGYKLEGRLWGSNSSIVRAWRARE